MVAESSGASNIVEEFEEAFQSCLNVLTKQESGPCTEKEEVKVEVERFIDLARQMEAFFLQKRFLLSALKPELLVKEDNNDLRSELARKEELLKRHYDKIAEWQNLLADLQQGYTKCPVPAAVTPTGSNSGAGVSPVPSSGTPQPPMQVMQQHQQMNPMQNQQQMQHAAAMQAQQLQQFQQLQQQQQQHAAMQQQMSGAVPPGMYMQQGPRGAFPQPGSLQGPLAYLEKTTTNIDLVGMGDGRR